MFKKPQRGQALIMFTLMLPVLMMMTGLAIDRTMLFIVEAKLDSAVDGAALGSGRLLGTSANTNEIAGEFLTANFPANYWGSYNFTPTISSTNVLSSHTISVGASVRVPLLFMRMFGPGYNTVTAFSQSTRKDSRIMIVLDRSGSMAGTPVAALKTAATQFVGMFSGSDELGLVVLGSSAIVAYPTTRPYNADPKSAGGPDTNYATTQSNGNMVTMISAIAAGGDTGTAEAMSLAYIELQKAHNRDVALYGSDDRLNAILLFTDGQPTSISVNLNTANTLAGTSIKAGGQCTYKSTTAAANEMIGWIGDFGFGNSAGFGSGLYRLQAYDANTAAYWMANPSQDVKVINPLTPISNCQYLQGAGQNYDLTDLQKIPTYDLYNNSTTNSFYTQSWLYTQSNMAGTAYDPTQPTSQYHLGIAAWNASDNVGNTIRTQNAMNPITIYTIGYLGNGGVDTALLQRLANNQGSPSYNATQPTGVYVPVGQTSDLLAAFYTVASTVLRLSK